MHKTTVTVLAFRKKKIRTHKCLKLIKGTLYYDHTRLQIHGVDLVCVLILFQNTSYDDEFLGMNACPAVSPLTSCKRLQNNNR